MKKGFSFIEFVVVTAICAILLIMIVVSVPDSKTPSAESASPATSVIYPEPTDYVVDQAGVLKPETISKLDAQLKGLDPKVQIAVVMIKTTQPLDLESYTIGLADKWKVGHAGADNGIILLVATEDRKIRIEVGTGLEGDLTDGQAGDIIRTIITPKLKTGDWDGGVLDGVSAIINHITK